jgi:CRP-like cAMP-binding protein
MPDAVVNRLIEGLPRAERNRLLARCDLVDLRFGMVLCERDRPLRHAWFPLTGFISQLVPMEGHQALELGMIGNEGMLGATLVLGVGTARLRGVVQGDGTALRITTPHLKLELKRSAALRQTFNRYLFVKLVQLSQSAACTSFHEVEARLARWLLMSHDRAHADHFNLTHQFLAGMLGVRRSAVTIAAGTLAGRSLISYSRGTITVLDRGGLEAASCMCYDAGQADYRRQFSPL